MPFTILFSVKTSAEGIFGAGGRLPVGNLYGHVDQIRKKRVVFDFQNRALLQHRRAEKFSVQKIRAAKAGAYVAVQRDPDIPWLIDKGFPVIADNGSGTQALSLQFAVEFHTERLSRFQKKTVFSAKQLLNLLCRHFYTLFSAQTVDLEFFLQPDEGKGRSVISEPEFFPFPDSVQLFPQRAVIGRVEVQAGDPVRPVGSRIFIMGKQLSQPLGEHQIILRADLVLVFMPHTAGSGTVSHRRSHHRRRHRRRRSRLSHHCWDHSPCHHSQ